MKRCEWAGGDGAYIAYHDTEWGVPVHDDRLLFEFLILEGTQAGLSWLTVLRKRAAYRKAYDGFDPEIIAEWPQEKIDSLLLDQGIIRNRLKVEAARSNALAYQKTVNEFGSFAAFVWSFVENRPIVNAWKSIRDIPAATPESERMSRELQKRGFKFVGPTICYAFMQAVGLVNDHTVECFRYRELKK